MLRRSETLWLISRVRHPTEGSYEAVSAEMQAGWQEELDSMDPLLRLRLTGAAGTREEGAGAQPQTDTVTEMARVEENGIWDSLLIPYTLDGARHVVEQLLLLTQGHHQQQQGAAPPRSAAGAGLRVVRVNCSLMGDEGVRHFVDLVRLVPTVQELMLTAAPLPKRFYSGNPGASRRSLTWRSALRLHHLLMTTTTLRRLDLPQCGLSARATALLALALASNSSLVRLDLSGNTISPDAAKALSQAGVPFLREAAGAVVIALAVMAERLTLRLS